jgi:regulator of cell morphogenesis and NO signaling
VGSKPEIAMTANSVSIGSYSSNYYKQQSHSSSLQIRVSNVISEPSTVDNGILAGIALQSINAAFESPCDSSQQSMSELIQYIVRTHHHYIREELPRLHALCDRIIAKREWMNPEFIGLTRKLRRLAGDLTFHMSHTENKVFPYIEALERNRKQIMPLASSSAAMAESLIEEVMVGHSPAGEMLRQIEIDTNGFTPPKDACPDMIGLYQGLKELAIRRNNHIQLEGYILFPRALAIEKKVLAA